MHRVTRATLGTVAIGLVAVFFVAGMVGGGLLGAIHMPGQAAKGSPGGAATKSAAPLTPAARTYPTTISLYWNATTLLGYTSPIPASFQFYVNVSFGSIDNTHTKAWVWLLWNNSGVPTYEYNVTLTGTVNTSAVATYYNNGVYFENYTWTVNLNQTTLGCTTASCAASPLVTAQVPYIFEVFVSENGASMGGGWAFASLMSPTTPIFPGTILVATFVTAGFITPAPPSTAIPAEVQFFTNISWGWTTNTTTFLSLEISNDSAGYAMMWNFSFDHLINYSNSAGLSVVPGFNGTVAGVPYSYATWTMYLTNKTLGCGTPAACTTFFGLGLPYNLTIWANENGAAAGGDTAPTGPVAWMAESLDFGTTFINAGILTPLPVWAYQDLPFVATGWINTTYVDPTATDGNTTIYGYVIVTDLTTSTVVGYLSLNGSFTVTPGFTNGNGVALSSVFNGSYPVGNTTVGVTYIPYENYSWVWVLSATSTSLGAVVTYNDIYDLTVVMYANGTAFGGVNQTATADVLTTTFVQYPTTTALAFTTTFSAYNPIPLKVNYTIAVTNAPISPATTTILVNVTDTSTSTLLTSTAVTPVSNKTAYTFSVDAATLLCNNAACTGLPQDEFQVLVFLGVNGINGTTNGSIATSVISKSFFLIPTPLSAELVTPAPGVDVSIGNVTVSVAYSGSWVAGAVLNIYASTHAIVFTKSVIELTPGVPVGATWFVGQTGIYNYSIVITTVYALPTTTHYFNGTITVITKGGTVFSNTTKWSNQTIISGLSGAVSGTILLVVGLVVGMIVALVLARAVMGRPAQAPPQPWESKPGAAPGAAPNTCSVCGKSFATPEELAAHGKAEHGMQ